MAAASADILMSVDILRGRIMIRPYDYDDYDAYAPEGDHAGG